MRKVFLENLPKKYGIGANKDKLTVDWKNSIGYTIKFIYDDINDELEIINYETKGQILTIKYKDRIKPIKTSDILNCKIGNILMKNTKDFKIEIGTTIKDSKRYITIIDREYRIGKNGKYLKYYKYHCNIDGNEDWMTEYNLLSGNGCNVCSGDKVTEYNCMWNTHRNLCIALGIPKEVAETVTAGSGKDITFPCKYCRNLVTCKPYVITKNHSVACKHCGDGITFPEKIMMYLLKKSNKNYIYQYSPEYLKREENGKLSQKRNDFYLPNLNMVIEVNGGIGHEGGIVHGKSIKTLDELIEVDKWKEEQNLKHGVKTVNINCFISELMYIKNNILNSELTNYIDFNNIDWEDVEMHSLNNIVKEVCDYWKEHREINNEDITTKDLAEIFNFNRFTIIRYLKIGTKFKWCNYNGKEEKNRNYIKKSKQVLMYDKNNNLILKETASYIEEHSLEKFGVKLLQGGITSVCREEKPQYKGYIFKYAD